MGHRCRVDGLLAGLGIDRSDHVLRHRFLVPQPLAIGAVERFEDAELARGYHRLAGLAVDRKIDEHPLVDVIEVPGVVFEMLVVPLQLPGVGIDGEGRVRVHRAVLGAGLGRQRPAHLGDPRIGLAGAVIDEVLVGVIAPGNPRRGAEPALQRQSVPGVVIGVAGMGDGVDPPQLLAGLGVMAGDEAAAGLGIAATGHALDHLAVDDEGAAGVAPALVPVGSGVVPHHLSGLGIERDDMGVRGGGDEIALIDRHVAAGKVLRAGDQPGREITLVFPDQVAGRRIERLDLVAEIEDVEHAVMDDRRRLGGAACERPAPCDLEVFHVGLVDLLQRAVAVAVIGAPPHQPVRCRWVAQHRIGDRRQVADGIGCLGLLRERRRAGEQQ